jgi:uncharacterized membrane protein YgcG
MMKRLIGVMIFLVMIIQVSAVTLTLQPDSSGKDAWLISAPATRNNGASTGLDVAVGQRNILMQFNLSDLPVGVEITGAALKLYTTAEGGGADQIAQVHRINRSWVEGTGDNSASGDGATWNTYDGTNNWLTDGGDYDVESVVNRTISAADTWYDWDIESLVNSWYNGSLVNNGFIIRSLTTGSGTTTFASSDNSNSSIRPILEINYTLPINVTFVAPTTSNNSQVEVSYVFINVSLTGNASSGLLEWNGVNESLSNTSPSSWFLNKTGLVLGNYTFKVFVNNSANTFFASEIRVVSVVDNSAPTFNQSLGNQLLLFGADFSYKVNASDNNAVDGYFVNDTVFSMNKNTGVMVNATALGVGSYTLNVSVNDTSNNRVSETFRVTVQDNSAPTFNQTLNNQVVELGNSFTYKVNASDNNALDGYFVNDTVFSMNKNTGVMVNGSALIVGVYTLNVSVNDTSNNRVSETFRVTVQDTMKPIFEQELNDQSVKVGIEFSYDVNASDASVVSYFVNDSNFRISASGVITNGTTLSVKVFTLNVSINDTQNNLNSSTFMVTVVNDSTPSITSTNPGNGSVLAAGTTSTLVELVTDEVAVCRYNVTDTSFANMTQLNNTNATDHNFTITGLSDGSTFNYYFRCEDNTGNRMNSSHYLQFSVASAGDSGGSGGSGGGGGGGGSSSGGSGGGGAAASSAETDSAAEEESSEVEADGNETSEVSEEVPALFDVAVDFTTEIVEDELVAKISLVNFGGSGYIEVGLTYKITNDAGEILLEEQDVVPVEVQTEYLKAFNVSGWAEQEYTLEVELNYAGQKEPAVTQKVFTVGKKGKSNFLTGAVVKILDKAPWAILLVYAVLFLCVGSGTFYYLRHREGKKDSSFFSRVLPTSKTEGKTGQSILALSSVETLQNKVIRELKSKAKIPCIYVSLNKTNKAVRKLLKRGKVSTRKIYFIDCVSQGISQRDALSISAGRLDLLSAAIGSFLKHVQGKKELVIDNLAALLADNPERKVAQFINRITAYASQNQVRVVAFSPRTHLGNDLSKEIFNYFDKVQK